jgi:hypothetical protein
MDWCFYYRLKKGENQFGGSAILQKMNPWLERVPFRHLHAFIA